MACPSYCDFTGDFPQKDDDSIIVQWEVVLGTLSDWFRNQSLAILTGVTPVIPTQFYIKLHSTESTAEAAGTEITGGNYFKTPIAFEAISEIQLRNTSTINSQLSTDDWGAVASMSLWDENDNYYAFGNLRFPINVITGKGLQWPAGNVTIGIGNITGQGFSLLYIEKILTSFLLSAPDVPGQMQISAHNAASTYLEAGTELSGNGYERIDVTFTRSTDRVYVNAAQATSPNPATATWSILSLCLFDSLGEYYGFFNTSITVLSGESLKFEPGVVQASLGNLTASGNEGPAIGFTTETGRIIDRPKYTPDPPPMVNDPEFQRIVEYQGRQNNRIEDLWPVSLERRVAALEGALPYARGVWPILDVAGLTFEGTLAEQLFIGNVFLYANDRTYSRSEADFTSFGLFTASSGLPPLAITTIGKTETNEKGVTIALRGDNTQMFRTTDGATWTTIDLSSQNVKNYKGLINHKGTLYVVGNCVEDYLGNSGPYPSGMGWILMKSTDGTTWTEVSKNNGNATDGANIPDVVASANQDTLASDGDETFAFTGSSARYDAANVSGKIMYSTNEGQTFAESQAPRQSTIGAPLYGLFYNLGYWFLLANEDIPSELNKRAEIWRSTSPSGGWSTVSISPTPALGTTRFADMDEYDGTLVTYSRFNKSGVTEYLFYSTNNGANWTQSTRSWTVDFGEQRLITTEFGFGFAGGGQNVWYSTDGITWLDTNLTNPNTQKQYAFILYLPLAA